MMAFKHIKPHQKSKFRTGSLYYACVTNDKRLYEQIEAKLMEAYRIANDVKG